MEKNNRLEAENPKIDTYELTILMPCLNEEANIAYSLAAAKDFLTKNQVPGELLVVDNNSRDDSVKIAVRCGARVVREDVPGYGAALRAGIAAAQGTYIILGDCDATYDFKSLMPFLLALREGFGLVMGNRFAGGIAPGAMPLSHRIFGIPFLSWLGRMRYHVPVTDFHCGLRGLSASMAKELPFETTGMEFSTELIALSAKAGVRITELPVTLAVSPAPRRSHLHTLRDGMRHLLYLCRH